MKSIALAVLAAVTFGSLIFIAAVHNWLGLSLKNEVRPVEAITLVVNLLIAFFLQRFFTTRINDLRAEKNVLIDAIKEIIRHLNEVSERTDAQLNKASIDDADKFAILYGFRRIANAITDFEDSVRMSHLKSIIECLPVLWSHFYDLKIVATGDGFPSRGYSLQQQNSQQLHFRSLKTHFRRLIFKINDAQK
jgi:hypothetical protein